MDFMGIPLFSVMKAKLGYHSDRQSILAQNVANADVPDYKAKDIAAPDFRAIAAQLQTGSSNRLPLSTTNQMHVTSGSKSGLSFMPTKRASTYELNPNGNNVVIEEEMMRIAENQAEYQKVLSLYRKTIDMFKTAIGKPTG